MLDARRLREGFDDVGLAVLDLRFVSLRGFLQRVERAFPVAEGGLGLLLAFGHLPAQGFALGDLPLPFVLPCAHRFVFFFRGHDARLKLGLLLRQEFPALPGLLKRMLDPVDVRIQFMQDGLRRRGTLRGGRAFGLQRLSLLVEARTVALERHPPLLQAAYLFEQGRVRPTQQRQIDRAEFVLQGTIPLRLFRLAAQGTELAAHLVQQVGHAGQVVAGPVEFALRCQAPAAEQAHPGRFLHQGADLVGFRVDERLHAPLLDDRVRFGPGAGPQKELDDVAEPARELVEQIFRVARPEVAARDHDLRPVASVSGKRHVPVVAVEAVRHVLPVVAVRRRWRSGGDVLQKK